MPNVAVRLLWVNRYRRWPKRGVTPRSVSAISIGGGLIAPAGVDPPTVVADTRADFRRRRWVVGHWSVVGRRRNVRGDCVGDVGTPTYRNAPASAGTHVGVGDPGGVNNDDSPGDGRERQDGRRRGAPCPCPTTHAGPFLTSRPECGLHAMRPHRRVQGVVDIAKSIGALAQPLDHER
jgi:hypothetical protein